MLLKELEASFLSIKNEREFWPVDTLQEADGVWFLCPSCYIRNQGGRGTHGVIYWRTHVPEEIEPGPVRWSFAGTGIDDLTLHPQNTNSQLREECQLHFFVHMGRVYL